jgi:hypothetical protein
LNGAIIGGLSLHSKPKRTTARCQIGREENGGGTGERHGPDQETILLKISKNKSASLSCWDALPQRFLI